MSGHWMWFRLQCSKHC